MQLGEFRVDVISGGRFKIDGGTLFGVVPKALWNRRLEADSENRVPQGANCLLVDTGRERIVIDTGYGDKLNEKQRRILAAQSGNPIREELDTIGASPESIDFVILSHLHFDHAGGCTALVEGGSPRAAFPNAQYVVQRREWMVATANLPELKGVYPVEDLLPLADAQRLWLIDGPTDIAPGIRALPTGGHSVGHQAVQITSGGEGGIYLGDLCPTSHHLPVRWGLAYDLDVLETRRQKSILLSTITDHDWVAFFAHDPHLTHTRLRRDEKRDFAVKESFPINR